MAGSEVIKERGNVLSTKIVEQPLFEQLKKEGTIIWVSSPVEKIS